MLVYATGLHFFFWFIIPSLASYPGLMGWWMKENLSLVIIPVVMVAAVYVFFDIIFNSSANLRLFLSKR